MGWLPQIKPTARYDASWMQRFVESVRTAVNYVDQEQIKYRTYVGSPTGVLTPQCVGEEILDTTNSNWYKATGLTNASWKLLT